MIDVRIDIREIERASSMFAATIREADLARTRALRRTAREIRTQVRREAARELRIPQRALSGRLYLSRVRPGDEAAALWIGTLPVPAVAVGRPRQTKKGVRVGRRSWRGAFVARIYGREQVWIRRSSRHYDPALYPTRHRAGDRFGAAGHLRGRFPVVRAAVAVDGVVEAVVRRAAPRVPGLYARKWDQELNYVLNVRR
ncbi:hypothetical protein G3N55_00115 [Dissulfurirhabdus thermomarina]|uniref:Phage tail protein n=1 Tax=Dissulfurirhabdus thermomarina TaxID=1765737 RepID=A0A6N9TN91_DISTH|nr:hypothetical protein [Dissulfurirhabdus thermomarina]NDY41254.1 hypothetical protein [Dissulfurirhabdus thermomarina]